MNLTLLSMSVSLFWNDCVLVVLFSSLLSSLMLFVVRPEAFNVSTHMLCWVLPKCLFDVLIFIGDWCFGRKLRIWYSNLTLLFIKNFGNSIFEEWKWFFLSFPHMLSFDEMITS